jgi:arylsulfatase A-like enzyme
VLRRVQNAGHPDRSPNVAGHIWADQAGGSVELTLPPFPGQGGGLPAGEWTLASVLKRANYDTCHIGKWHLGESDYSMPTEHGFDEMWNTTLYHLNAYTYTYPAFNPDFPFDNLETMKMWGNVIGAVGGKTGEKWREVETLDSAKIPFIDEESTKAAVDYLDAQGKCSA